ncbi:Gfo/Idh/MocA family oxidoreductase [Nigerium sp.]|jgi:predicted dehydrogenase|uniref:Gfo/Idh/MocA family oxidoreductase n=1 Tax=Nigerium sp. TaxID=2042655 RepID=UPI0032214038
MTVLGVFGAGVMGGNHVRTARALREWSEVYVGDVDSDKAREVARRNGFRARDLAKADLDAAIVAVPSDLHEEVVLPLLDRGVHVLLEKPVAQELGSAQRILDAARDSESRVVVGHVERFNSAVSELLKWAPKAQHVEFRRVGPAGGRALGDVVSDLMVHDLDLLLAISRARDGHDHITRCSAQWGAGNQETCSALLTTDGGLTSLVVASRAGQMKDRQVVLTCPDAVVVADLVRQQVSVHRMERMEFVDDGGTVRFRQTSTTEIPFLDNGEPLIREQRHFFDVVAHGASPAVSLGDGVAAMQLVERVRQEASRG